MHLFVNCNNIKRYTEVTTTFSSVFFLSVYSSKALISTSVKNDKYSKEYVIKF